MASQLVCSLCKYPKIEIESSNRHSIIQQLCSFSSGVTDRSQRFQLKCAGKSSQWGLNWVNKPARAHSTISDLGRKFLLWSDLENITSRGNDEFESFRGKPGSISFNGLTHQIVEEGNLQSSPTKPGSGSFLWLAGCMVLMLSYVLPPVLLGSVINIIIKDVILAEIVVSLTSEATFYSGFAAFLVITDHVHRSSLQSSPKRWSFNNGLRGYSTSAFLTSGLKTLLPLFAVYTSWQELGLNGLIAVAPLLVGCLAQFLFEFALRIRNSSCWPLVPIIFEMYRIYQITRAVYFIERLVYAMAELPKSPLLMERGDALVGMVVILQVLGLVCLWSLITFLVRLFPCKSRMTDNY